MDRPLPSRVALPVAALGGLAVHLSFPQPGWWPLAPVGVGLLLLAVAGRSARGGALIGLVHGLATFVPLLSWSGTYVGPVPWLALATLQAAYVALLGLLLPRAMRSPAAVLVVPALWVAQEALRARTPYGGFPWGRLAFSQADAPTAHLAALGGAPLVSFAVALAGTGLALAWTRGRTAAPSDRGRVAARARRALPHAAVAVAVLLGGVLVPLPTSGTPVRVAGIQGDVPSAGLDFNAERRAVLDNHARGTATLAAEVRAGRQPRPDLVVWPENSSDIDPYRQADARAVISTAVDDIGVPTLVGAVLQQPADRLTNASIVWSPETATTTGGPGASYSKRHPVPFGEYIPDRELWRRVSPQVDLVARDFVAGEGPGVLDLGPATAGVAICFEVAYDDLVRDTVTGGADLLVVQTNNATFGRSDEAVQQLAMSRLRAVEHGRSVAHVSTVGVSALIAPDGSLRDSSGLFEPAVLTATLPLRDDLTVADRLGAWPEAVLVVAGLLGLVLAGRGWRTTREDVRRPAGRVRGARGADRSPQDPRKVDAR